MREHPQLGQHALEHSRQRRTQAVRHQQHLRLAERPRGLGGLCGFAPQRPGEARFHGGALRAGERVGQPLFGFPVRRR